MTDIEERAKELENTIEYCPVGDEYQVLLKALQAQRDDMREEHLKLIDYIYKNVVGVDRKTLFDRIAQEIRDLK